MSVKVCKNCAPRVARQFERGCAGFCVEQRTEHGATAAGGPARAERLANGGTRLVRVRLLKIKKEEK